MKTLYYVVKIELEGIDGGARTTGKKTITLYEIWDYKLERFRIIESFNEDNTVDTINEYMKEKNIYPNNYTLIEI